MTSSVHHGPGGTDTPGELFSVGFEAVIGPPDTTSSGKPAEASSSSGRSPCHGGRPQRIGGTVATCLRASGITSGSVPTASRKRASHCSSGTSRCQMARTAPTNFSAAASVSTGNHRNATRSTPPELSGLETLTPQPSNQEHPIIPIRQHQPPKRYHAKSVRSTAPGGYSERRGHPIACPDGAALALRAAC